jgi:hypothetical protein
MKKLLIASFFGRSIGLAHRLCSSDSFHCVLRPTYLLPSLKIGGIPQVGALRSH